MSEFIRDPEGNITEQIFIGGYEHRLKIDEDDIRIDYVDIIDVSY